MRLRAVLFDFGGTLDSDGIAWPQRFFPLYQEEGITAAWESFQTAFYRSDDALDRQDRLKGMSFAATLDL
ncbi:MAG: HAD-superfamily hydrolase, subfamily IA, variant 3, partial [Elusimicrobia bacterium]